MTGDSDDFLVTGLDLSTLPLLLDLDGCFLVTFSGSDGVYWAGVSVVYEIFTTGLVPDEALDCLFFGANALTGYTAVFFYKGVCVFIGAPRAVALLMSLLVY